MGQFDPCLMYRQLFYTSEAIRSGKLEGLFKLYGIEDNDIYKIKKHIPHLHQAWDSMMIDFSSNTRRNFLKKFDYSSYRKIIDVGCNDAELIVQLAKRFPQFSETVIDLPDSPGLENAKQNITANNLEDRIKAVGMDVFEETLPGEADLVQLFHFVNMFSPQKNQLLFHKLFESLNSGGTLLVVGPVIREYRTGFVVEEPVLYSLVFLVCKTGEGRIYSIKDIKSWMKSAGFIDIRLKTFKMLEVIITARKPALSSAPPISKEENYD